jgi:hypothetical protein
MESARGPPGRSGPGFGSSIFLTNPLLRALDADQDSKVPRDELLAGVKKLFGECQKGQNGSLDTKQIAEQLNRILPRPSEPACQGVELRAEREGA